MEWWAGCKRVMVTDCAITSTTTGHCRPAEAGDIPTRRVPERRDPRVVGLLRLLRLPRLRRLECRHQTDYACSSLAAASPSAASSAAHARALASAWRSQRCC
jgi:hypothetical protein